MERVSAISYALVFVVGIVGDGLKLKTQRKNSRLRRVCLENRK